MSPVHSETLIRIPPLAHGVLHWVAVTVLLGVVSTTPYQISILELVAETVARDHEVTPPPVTPGVGVAFGAKRAPFQFAPIMMRTLPAVGLAARETLSEMVAALLPITCWPATNAAGAAA